MSFSLEKLEKLMQNDPPSQKSFVDLFVSEIQNNELPLLEESLKSKDIKAIKARAHSIKSNALFFGLKQISEELQSIESWPSDDTYSDELEQKVLFVKNELNTVCIEMDEWSKNLNSTI